MLVLPDMRPTEPRTKSNRVVIVLVRDDERARTSDSRDGSGIRCETHADHSRVFLAYKARDEPLGLLLQVQIACTEPASETADAVRLEAFLDCVCAASVRLCETEVVVCRDVERTRLFAGKLETVKVVARRAVEHGDCPSADTRDGTGEAIVESLLEAAGVERVEIRVERGVAIVLHQMIVGFREELLAKVVAHVADCYEEQVGEVGTQHGHVRGLLFDWIGQRTACSVLRCVSVVLVAAESEFGVQEPSAI